MASSLSHARAAMRIYLVLASAYLASQFYRVANAAIAPELMAELGLSAEAMGAITGVFFLAFAAAQVPTGVVLDRFGPRRTMAGLFLVAVLGALTFALARDALMLGLARVLMGLGCAAGLMGSMVAISRWFEPARFAQLSSLVFVVGGAGTLLATTPLAWAVELIGWRGAFLVMAGLTFGFAVLLFAVVRDAPPGQASGGASESWRQIGRGLGQVVRNPEIWKVSAIQFVTYASIITVIGLWAGPYLSDIHGLEVVARGNVLLVLNLAVLAGVLAYGWIDRRVPSRKWLLVAGAAASAGLMTALALLPDAGFWPALALLVAFTLVGSYVMLNHAHARSILPDHLVGRGLTFQNLAAFLGIFALQSVSGLIVGSFAPAGGAAPEAAYRAVFGFLAACLLVAALVFATAREPSPQAASRAPAAPPPSAG